MTTLAKQSLTEALRRESFFPNDIFAAAAARIEALERVMRFYEDEGNWNKACVDDGRAGYTWTRPIIKDAGQRARAVLKESGDVD